MPFVERIRRRVSRMGWGARLLLAVAGVLTAASAVGVTGLLVGSTVLQAAGLAMAFVMVPPALIQVAMHWGGPDDDSDDGGGGGPPPPPDPPRLPPSSGPDWTEFDEVRRAWEREAVRT
ncbi:MAG TPA: hypothetical protein VD931_07015 [Baekduia sp.]|nr:hypothetical protein [Baekduia sp.]